ncbi:cobalamin biosynthesis protein [Vibrio sp. SCSIO 43136]|uniref:cobalamin biosynthesis protein n=1 Tax=Vibrio sp. SCSIO 43136 TaxID=2819101 RepID=UPI0020764636|nr:cobalamin biosynthesis protein [Vibrio sp. SCSIO 43136]USD66874.1 cobalamin biosynthesis protein [Vibrio sp. SCSIO 43136]
MKIAIYAITLNGAKQANRLAKAFPFADVYVANVGRDECPDAQSLPLPLSEFLPSKFKQYDHHICLFAAGIVTRMLAPLLEDKRSDPGVLCVDDHGQFVVPMLSGHRGGANALAHRVAKVLSATPVVTTASDVAGTISVDLLGAPFGWQLDPRCEQAITKVSAAVVNEQPVLVAQHCGEPTWWAEKKAMPSNIVSTNEPDLSKLSCDDWQGMVLVSDQKEPQGFDDWESKSVLWRPKTLVLGVGCDRNTPAHVIATGITQFLEQFNLSRMSIEQLVSIDLKADEQGLLEYAQASQIPFSTFAPSELDGLEGIENPSDYVKKVTGVSSVAEAAALKASQRNKLLAAKWKFKLDGYNMTLACCRKAYEEPLASKKWKHWLGEKSVINAHGSEVVTGYQCKPKHVDLNRPMLYHRYHLLICEGARCAQQGSRNLAHELRQILKSMGLDKGEHRIKISRTHCAGSCRNRAAMVVYQPSRNIEQTTTDTLTNNGIWVRGIDQFSESQWRALFECLKQKQPLQSHLAPEFIAPIENKPESI